MSHIFDWNGKDLPEALRSLPKGRYVLEAVDEVPAPTDAELAGLARGMESARAGRLLTPDEARRALADRRAR